MILDLWEDHPQSVDRFEYRQALSRRFRVHGLTIDDYDEMMINQLGKCFICNKVLHEFVIDHCHTSGKVRGLLCNSCNSFIGIARESVDILYSSIEYLQYFRFFLFISQAIVSPSL